MQDMIDKRDRAELFRRRLADALGTTGQSQSSLARAVGVDRSTISALLAPGTRLPNAQLAADCAMALDVSCDWLLGMSDRPEPSEKMLRAVVQAIPAARALFDDTVFSWHREAAGYKIRHVPASLPDILKTREVVLWEYRDALGAQALQALTSFEAQLQLLRTARSDYEIAMPLHEIDCFAQAVGYWAGIPLGIRMAQLDHLILLCDDLYPSLRLYFFDAHCVFSAPVTVFGPNLAAIYLGRSYFAFRDKDQVAEISQHFDWLVREAPLGARDAAQHLRQLRQSIAQ